MSMSSDPGSESFLRALRPIPRILILVTTGYYGWEQTDVPRVLRIPKTCARARATGLSEVAGSDHALVGNPTGRCPKGHAFNGVSRAISDCGRIAAHSETILAACPEVLLYRPKSKVRGSRRPTESCILFLRSRLTLPEGEGPASRSKL
jgi:hypothetical protein